jgi:hypothetical protein
VLVGVAELLKVVAVAVGEIGTIVLLFLDGVVGGFALVRTFALFGVILIGAIFDD